MAERRFPKVRSLGPSYRVWVDAEIDAWIWPVAGLTD
ncbi:AlpA family phage regulatory protein [Novosphingobium fuchskuhlense]|nr:AlpA family phage regulatory protein [Novosphingobium fuchskuhlense]